MKTVFDIESDGLLPTVTKIHCVALKRIGIDDDVISYTDNAYSKRAGTLKQGLMVVLESDTIIGHNIQGFDIPCIKKIFPRWDYQGQVRDTLIMSRMQQGHNMIQHGLGAWGDRLRFPKGDFGEQSDWKLWSKAMQLYCEQDVRLNYRVWVELLKDKFPDTALDLEHEFAYELDLMMEEGVYFDTAKAETLAAEIITDEERQRNELTRNVPPFVDESTFIPKVTNKSRGYVKGVPCIKRKETPFNCGSRTQVVRFLKEKYNWIPEEFTDKGNPKVSGDILRDLPYPECSTFAAYFDTRKLLGQLHGGAVAWLKVQKGGKIHGYINHNGAITGRCTHSGPNLAQVPSPRGYKGTECRELFYAPEGYKIVGCDASGLELRNLAHYMFEYDGGEYAQEILQGDIHTKNQTAAELPTRDNAKTFIYAHNYGAGDAKLGLIVAPDSDEAERKVRGKIIRTKFMAAIPALATVIQMTKNEAKKLGYIVGLDGRKLQVHSQHVALNVKLQGAGAVFMKKSTVICMKEIRRRRLRARLVLHIHDEYNFLVWAGHTAAVAKIAEDSMRLAGEFFNYNIPMEGVAKVGRTWKDVH